MLNKNLWNRFDKVELSSLFVSLILKMEFPGVCPERRVNPVRFQGVRNISAPSPFDLSLSLPADRCHYPSVTAARCCILTSITRCLLIHSFYSTDCSLSARCLSLRCVRTIASDWIFWTLLFFLDFWTFTYWINYSDANEPVQTSAWNGQLSALNLQGNLVLNWAIFKSHFKTLIHNCSQFRIIM